MRKAEKPDQDYFDGPGFGNIPHFRVERRVVRRVFRKCASSSASRMTASLRSGFVSCRFADFAVPRLYRLPALLARDHPRKGMSAYSSRHAPNIAAASSPDPRATDRQ